MLCLPTMTLRPCDCDLRRRWRLRRRQSMHSRYCAAFVARRSTAALHRGVLGPSSPSSSSIPGSYPFHSFDFVRSSFHDRSGFRPRLVTSSTSSLLPHLPAPPPPRRPRRPRRPHPRPRRPSYASPCTGDRQSPKCTSQPPSPHPGLMTRTHPHLLRASPMPHAAVHGQRVWTYDTHPMLHCSG